MCGESLNTDIVGADSRGWEAVLVTREGLFSGCETLDFCK